MTKLSPSILSADFSRLGQDCRQVLEAGADMLHYDVMDGHFVPNISFGVPVLKSLHAALPDAFYDVHLMISRPQDYLETFVKAGASLITFHLESDCDAGHRRPAGAALPGPAGFGAGYECGARLRRPEIHAPGTG